MKILIFDCFSGISGDMTVGALLDLGLPIDYLRSELEKLTLTGYSLESLKTSKQGIAATKFEVRIKDDKEHRHLGEILRLIEESRLSEMAKDISSHAFRVLADAEARIHGTTAEKVHFHEVGGIDAIIDIVGSAVGIGYFGPDRIVASPLPLGTGIASSSHGTIPIPAPATVEILKGVPVAWNGIEGERVTPTGAAILATLLNKYKGDDTGQDFSIVGSGYGAGTKDFTDRPNLLRVILGESVPKAVSGRDEIEVLETNIDDMNPQIYDYLFKRLYAAGASEVFISPVIMKKNRPGSLLTVLCKKGLVDSMGDIIFAETSTAGIRIRGETRLILTRTEKIVETKYGAIRVKILKVKKGIKIQPEYDDCFEAAMKNSVPLMEVIETARRAAENFEGIQQ